MLQSFQARCKPCGLSSATKQAAHIQGTGWISKTLVQILTCLAESRGCKMYRTSPVSAISECDTLRHWVWCGSQNPVTVHPASTGCKVKPLESFWESRVILWTTKETPIEAMHYLLDMPTCHQWKQEKKWSKSNRILMWWRILSIHSMILSRMKRGQDASHVWAKQNS